MTNPPQRIHHPTKPNKLWKWIKLKTKNLFSAATLAVISVLVFETTQAEDSTALKAKNEMEDMKTETKKIVRKTKRGVRKMTGTNTPMLDAKDTLNDAKDNYQNKENKLQNRQNQK